MSTHNYLRATVLAAFTTVAFAATAASANPQNSRYGDIYDYESGHNCGEACVAPPPAQPMAQPVRAPAYVPPQPVSGPPIYVDCSQMGSCGAQPATVFTQPQATYSENTTYSSAPANCPAGTTPQADGTCLQTSDYSQNTYSGTMTYNAPATCPAGTTAQADGSCLQTYQGDAQSSYGYQSSGTTTDYRPIRK